MHQLLVLHFMSSYSNQKDTAFVHLWSEPFLLGPRWHWAGYVFLSRLIIHNTEFMALEEVPTVCSFLIDLLPGISHICNLVWWTKILKYIVQDCFVDYSCISVKLYYLLSKKWKIWALLPLLHTLATPLDAFAKASTTSVQSEGDLIRMFGFHKGRFYVLQMLLFDAAAEEW